MTETINGVPLELLKRAVQIPSKASVEENHAAIVDRGRAQAELRDMLNAVPVSEAKAQGVVMPTVDQAMRVVLREMGSSKHICGTSNWCADVGRAVLDEVARLNAAHVQHPDDDAVDRFAVAMKVKLAASRKKGRHGWQNATGPHLSSLLHEHMYKGDPLDVGNLAMMLHQNGQAIELPHDARRVTPHVQQVSVQSVCQECNGEGMDRSSYVPLKHRDLDDCKACGGTGRLAAAPAAPAADAWIPVSERLPAVESLLDQECRAGTLSIAPLNVSAAVLVFDGEKVRSTRLEWFDGCLPLPYCITHWMPLPAAPAAHRAQGVV